jgi:hypothetical protein
MYSLKKKLIEQSGIIVVKFLNCGLLEIVRKKLKQDLVAGDIMFT